MKLLCATAAAMCAAACVSLSGVAAHMKLALPADSRYEIGKYTQSFYVSSPSTGSRATPMDYRNPLHDGCGPDARTNTRAAATVTLVEGEPFPTGITIAVNHQGSVRFGVQLYTTDNIADNTILEPATEGYMQTQAISTATGVVDTAPGVAGTSTVPWGYSCTNCAVWTFYETLNSAWWHSCSDVNITPANFRLMYAMVPEPTVPATPAAPLTHMELDTPTTPVSGKIQVRLSTPHELLNGTPNPAAGLYIETVKYYLNDPTMAGEAFHNGGSSHPFAMQNTLDVTDATHSIDTHSQLLNGENTLTAHIMFKYQGSDTNKEMYQKSRTVTATFTVTNTFTCATHACVDTTMPKKKLDTTPCLAYECLHPECCEPARYCTSIATQCVAPTVALEATMCAELECTVLECCKTNLDDPDQDGTGRGTLNPDGTITNPDGSVTNPDGTITNTDGTVTNPDGTITNTDGSITRQDGTILNTDGTITNPNGTILNTDGTITNPDGTITNADGSTVQSNGDILRPDGTVLRPNGEIVLVNGDILRPDGTVLSPDGTVREQATGTDITNAESTKKEAAETTMTIVIAITGIMIICFVWFIAFYMRRKQSFSATQQRFQDEMTENRASNAVM